MNSWECQIKHWHKFDRGPSTHDLFCYFSKPCSKLQLRVGLVMQNIDFVTFRKIYSLTRSSTEL